MDVPVNPQQSPDRSEPASSEPKAEATIVDLRPPNLCPYAHLTERQLTTLAHMLPKVDLHRHLEGSIEPEALIPIAQKHGIPLPSYDVETLRPFIQITKDDKTLIDFLKKFDSIGPIFASRGIIEEITLDVIRDASRDNVKYLELRYSPAYMGEAHSLSMDAVTEGVIGGLVRAALDPQIDTKVNLIVIVDRQRPMEVAWSVEKHAAAYRDRSVKALDLANDEFNYPPDPFEPVFKQAKADLLAVIAHASEAAGPQSAKTCIEKLGVERGGHFVRIYEDPAVEDLVRRMGMPIELCITSNVQTGAVPSLSSHPVRHYFDSGIKVTLNTDDPGVSGITLSSEFEIAMSVFGFTLPELEQVVINGVDASFATQDEKTALRDKVTAGFRDAESWLAALPRPA